MPPKQKKISRAKQTVRKKPPAKKAASHRPPEKTDDSFPVVGMGASAGGLKAFEKFFQHMPEDGGMAFVIVQHLDPKHESMMSSILGHHTRMKVVEAEDGMPVQPNHVYVKPPGKDLGILANSLQLMDVPATDAPGKRMPIDAFFRSLAQEQGEKGIAIVLSGTGTDGTLGIKEIKARGGMVMVQDTSEAEYPGMPQSAVNTGVADYVLPVEKMAEELMKYVEHPFMVSEKPETPEAAQEKATRGILSTVRLETGHDFTGYKRNTIRRRIERRMAVHQIDTMGHYALFVRQHRKEIEELFKDFLINVTNFFRDREAFDALQKKVIIPMLTEKRHNAPLRVWVAGCGTGEEAYSIAILILESLEELGSVSQVQVFATDIFPEAIEVARTGIFPNNISVDISEARLRRFFVRTDGGYRVGSKIREMVVFAVHDVAKDPPFSRIDLVSCRNLLIYMDTPLQKKVLPVFHYALRPGGFLFLGTSEGIGDFHNLFSTIDKKNRLFQREEGDSGALMETFNVSTSRVEFEESREVEVPEREKKVLTPNIRDLAEKAILQRFAPSSVVVNEKNDIIFVHGNTHKYLSIPAGEPSWNLLGLTRGEVYHRLKIALHEARRTGNRVTAENLQVRYNDEFLTVDVSVSPVKEKHGLMLIAFEEQELRQGEREEKETGGAEGRSKNSRVLDLEKRLKSTRQELQATIEELETANEELKSANEELQANNEELQSTNEELESSREELQSTNEELETLNAELSNKNVELTQVSDDIHNLLTSTDIATIFLDRDLRVKRFTPTAKKVFNLIDGDVGRLVAHITSKLDNTDVAGEAETVLDTLCRKETEVRTKEGDWFIMRILPYRTTEDVIEGVVIIFVDITGLKRAEIRAQEARDYAERIMNTMRSPFLVLDGNLRVVSANRAFYDTFQVSPKKTEGRAVYELGNRQWDIPDLRRLLEDVVPKDGEFQDFKVVHTIPKIGHKAMRLTGRRLKRKETQDNLILVAFEDVTERET